MPLCCQCQSYEGRCQQRASGPRPRDSGRAPGKTHLTRRKCRVVGRWCIRDGRKHGGRGRGLEGRTKLHTAHTWPIPAVVKCVACRARVQQEGDRSKRVRFHALSGFARAAHQAVVRLCRLKLALMKAADHAPDFNGEAPAVRTSLSDRLQRRPRAAQFSYRVPALVRVGWVALAHPRPRRIPPTKGQKSRISVAILKSH